MKRIAFLCLWTLSINLTAAPINLGTFGLPDSEDAKELLKRPEAPRGSMYLDGDPTLDRLIPVKVIGGVLRAGIHFIPPDTDLITLLSLAGGPGPAANLQKLTIRRIQNGKTTVIAVDVENLVTTTQSEPVLMMTNDVVFVPVTIPLISESVVQVVGLVGTSLGIILSSIAVLAAVSRKSNQ